MKALILATSWPLRPDAISGSFLRDLARALVAQGWEFEVVTPAPAGPATVVREPGIHVTMVPHPGARAGLAHDRGLPEVLHASPWAWALVPPMIAAMGQAALASARRSRFDLVWSHWLLPGGWIGAGVARAARLPHRVTAHGSDIHLLERLVRIPGARSVLERRWEHSVLSATSLTAARRIERALPGRTVSVCPLPAAAGVAAPGSGAPSLLFLGRFEPVKGPDLLLDASAMLPCDAVRHVKLAGAGSLELRLRMRARDLAHSIEFPGVLTGNAKVAALERAHALVVPSRCLRDGRADGLPHAALEALAVGTPVVAPAEGPLGDLLAETGGGIAYPAPRDDRRRSEHLAAALSSIVSHPERLASLRERARVAGRAFQPHAALAAWRPFLAECAA